MPKLATSKSVVWSGPSSLRCDICRYPIIEAFTDGRTRNGQWAIMCPSCLPKYGLNPPHGMGRGQKYELHSDGKWRKTEG